MWSIKEFLRCPKATWGKSSQRTLDWEHPRMPSVLWIPQSLRASQGIWRSLGNLEAKMCFPDASLSRITCIKHSSGKLTISGYSNGQTLLQYKLTLSRQRHMRRLWKSYMTWPRRWAGCLDNKLSSAYIHKLPAMGGNKDGAGSSRASKDILKLKKKWMWHSWQAYHNLMYDEIWKPIIDVEWDYYIKTWKAKHGNTPLTMNCFTFMNAFMKACYKDDDELKECVEKHQQNISKPPPAEVNASYQQLVFLIWPNASNS